MESKLFMISLILLSSWVFLGFSQGLEGVSSDSMPCMQKLLPCQPYLHPSSSPPPASCCVPLKEMIKDDSKCLCEIFNNPEILKSLNVSQAEALKLPKACGANADISACKKGSSSSNSTDSSAARRLAYGISHFGGSESQTTLDVKEKTVPLVVSAITKSKSIVVKTYARIFTMSKEFHGVQNPANRMHTGAKACTKPRVNELGCFSQWFVEEIMEGMPGLLEASTLSSSLL
ncbi:hypothetical protein HHK36_014829 [Tetracentron sinense]|uniref:Bifunctional inhibitor/plant lipid transfer protein/seed storage helical domain-containing protein n=1 Tax=Tetracentron sinense TaxID=13715 RepID=A0A834YZP3_TETSI|nr:hypothetical protein HHK36_014829 [Tetracentron sinense]